MTKDQHGNLGASNQPPKPPEKTIDEQILDAQNNVDEHQKQLNFADAELEKARAARNATAKNMRAAIQKQVTLESIKRNK